MRRPTRLIAVAAIPLLMWGTLLQAPSASATGSGSAAHAKADGHDKPKCTITGNDKSNKIDGTAKKDVICGKGGNDEIRGMSGDDILFGGPGADKIFGGEGNDKLDGGRGPDKCKQVTGHGPRTSCGSKKSGDKKDDDKKDCKKKKEDCKNGDKKDCKKKKEDCKKKDKKKNCKKDKKKDCKKDGDKKGKKKLIKVCPVKHGTVYNDFGDDRGDHSHEGNDIIAQKGEPVRASFPGTTENLTADGAGKYVKLTGKKGFTYGMHLDDWAKEGKVKTGDVIGYVGSSGNAGSTNHLHFEWHPKGDRAVDPFPLLSKVCHDTVKAPVSSAAPSPIG